MKIVAFHFDTIGSTNTWAKEHGHEFKRNSLTYVTASEQTAGRGRFKRKWESPAGVNIYATFCFFLEDDQISLIGYIPQLLALSTTKVIESLDIDTVNLFKFKPTIKWPNDVLLSGKKVAGILCETVSLEKRLVICGIGLNVNMAFEDLEKIDRPATSLMVESNKPFEVSPIREALKVMFLNDLTYFLEHGFDTFFQDFKRRSHFISGQKISFHDNQKTVQGAFHSLNKDGSVTLCLQDGTFKNYYAGEFVN